MRCAMKNMKIKKTKRLKKPAKIKKSKKLAGEIKTTTVFTNGQSQAIRIPKEFRVRGKKVYIKKVGNCLMIMPINDPWRPFFEALHEFSGDCLQEREVLPNQERNWSGFE